MPQPSENPRATNPSESPEATGVDAPRASGRSAGNTTRMRHHCGRRANWLMQSAAIHCLPLAYFLAWFAALWFWLKDATARRSSMDYFRHIMPDARRRTIFLCSYLNVYHYAVALIDASAVLTGHAGAFDMRFPQRARLAEAAAAPGGLLILTAHVGAIEITAPRLATMVANRQIHFVMYQDMEDATEKFRSENWAALGGIHIINSIDPISASLKIAHALLAGDVVGMRADRRVSGRSIDVPILGHMAQLPQGPFMAAVATGATVVSAFTFRTGYRRYELTVSKPRQYIATDSSQRTEMMARACADFAADLSDAVRQHPLDWFNFYPFWQPVSTAQSSDTN